jgi:hypothetical protein
MTQKPHEIDFKQEKCVFINSHKMFQISQKDLSQQGHLTI